MRIWIDINTPKQVLFFKLFYEKLLLLKYEVLLTSRKYREVELISDNIGLPLHYIGKHGGHSLYGKLSSSNDRVVELAKIINDWNPVLSISFSSPDCARVSYGLNIDHFSINDSPHSDKVARLTIPLSKLLFTPWIIPDKNWTDYGIGSSQIIKYNALDPVAWLKRNISWNDSENLNLDSNKKTITIRLEESQASYLHGVDLSNSFNLVNDLVNHFRDHNLIVLSRYPQQLKMINEKLGSKCIIPQGIVNGCKLLQESDLFIGLGGTMNAESALLGTPTISAYPGVTTIVEDFLIKKGLILRLHDLDKIIPQSDVLLNDDILKKKITSDASHILNEMEDPIEKIVSVSDTYLKNK